MIKKWFVCGITAGAFIAPAIAADAPLYKAPPLTPAYYWTGSYVGLHAGYTWTRADAGYAAFPPPFVPFSVNLDGSGFIGGAQWGYNYQLGNIVFGVESDISWANANGSVFLSPSPAAGGDLSLSQRLDWLSTLRARLGVAATDRLLIYGTAGVATAGVKSNLSQVFPLVTYAGSRAEVRVGWTGGFGAEYALAPNWSFKVEYLYFDVGSGAVVGIPNPPNPPFTSHAHFDLAGHMVRIGLNYRPDWGPWAAPRPAMYTKAPVMRDWQIESGARFWYSTGKTKKDLFDVPGTALVSRLTYTGLNGYSGESYARADHRMGFFLKGYLGTGKLSNGNLQDEDFPPFLVPYSSTNSSQRDGSISYGSVDAGYNFWRTPTGKLGAFAGYHYYQERLNAYGCMQNGLNPGICGAPGIPNNILVISQDNKWHSLRIGLNGDVALMNNLVLSGDAAWVPYGWLDGKDTHWLRINTPGGFAGPTPEDGRTRGVQLEALLNWFVTPNFTIGVGGRYWSMEVPNGKSHFEVSALPVGAFAAQVEKWKTERYGAFVQAGVKW
jgi:opacity protein-like surface antigen